MALHEGVIIFPSVHHVLKAERVLREHGQTHEVVPTPRELSSDCGIAITLLLEDLESALALLKEKGVDFDASYRRRGSAYERSSGTTEE